MRRSEWSDLAIRLGLAAAAVVLATQTGAAEAAWGLLGALVPTPRPGGTDRGAQGR